LQILSRNRRRCPPSFLGAAMLAATSTCLAQSADIDQSAPSAESLATLAQHFLAKENRKHISDCGAVLTVRPFDITRAPLKNGGMPLLLARARGTCLCSPTGNCAFWALIPDGTSFRILLSARTVQPYKVSASFSHEHPDLELIEHGSAFESTHRDYKFDGNAYRPTICGLWNYQDSENPDRILNAPRITSCNQ